MGKRKCHFILLILIISIFFTNIYTNNGNGTSKLEFVASSSKEGNGLNEVYDNYLIAAEGTGFFVIIETGQLYEAYTEYFVNVTIQVIAFGLWVDRIYDIYIDLSLVWSGGYWNSTIREIPEINAEGAYEYTIFGIALNEGDFGTLANNEEVSMTLYYYIELTEGVILVPDVTSAGQFDVFGITYRNTEASPVAGIYDVVLPPVYSDYETKMGLSVRTNAVWTTEKFYTVLVSFTAEEFPYDVDRFHTIQFKLHFKYSSYDYVSYTTNDLEIALGDTLVHNYHLGFSTSSFGGLSEGQQITVQIWFEMYYKEGVNLAIDPEYFIGPRYVYDITLKNEADYTTAGTKVTHNIDMDTSVILTHVAKRSWIYEDTNIYLNFTLFFAFNIYIEISSSVVLESYAPEEIATMDPFELYVKLLESDEDISIGALPVLGCIIHWIDKSDDSEYTFEKLDMPVPTLTDVDGDGTSVTFLSKTFYLWDSPIWTNGSLLDTYGYFLIVQDGITINIAEIEILQYILMLFPGVTIPSWLVTLDLVFAIHIYPMIYQILYLDYVGTAATIGLEDDGLYGFFDYDTTDTMDINGYGKSTITPTSGSTYSVEMTPGLFTYSYTEIMGSLDIKLDILGFTIFQFPLINLVSSVEDSISIVSYASESFTRDIQLETTTPTPTPTPTPTDNTTTPTDEGGIVIWLTLPIIVFSVFTLVIFRKKKS